MTLPLFHRGGESQIASPSLFVPSSAGSTALTGSAPSTNRSPQRSGAESITAKNSVWRSVGQQMTDLFNLLDQGDAMLDTWLADTQADRSAEMKKAQEFSAAAYNFRLKLESAHDSLAGDYADIAGYLKDTVRAPGRTPVPGSIFDQLIRSSDGFANELNSSPDHLEDRVTPRVHILRKDLQTVRNWERQLKQTAADEQNKELSK